MAREGWPSSGSSSTDERYGRTRQFCESQNRIRVRYPLAVATKEVRERFGGIEGLPTTMLYDRAGILRKKVVGFEYTLAFEAELRRLLWLKSDRSLRTRRAATRAVLRVTLRRINGHAGPLVQGSERHAGHMSRKLRNLLTSGR